MPHWTLPNKFPFFICSMILKSVSERLYRKNFRTCCSTLMVDLYNLRHSLSHILMTMKPFSCAWLRLTSSRSLFLPPRWISSSVRDKNDKRIPMFQTHCCNEINMQQHWNSQFSSVCFYCRSFPFFFWSCFLKIGQKQVFKAAVFVLLRCESTCLWINIPTRINRSVWVDTSFGCIVGCVSLINRLA